MQRPDIRIIDNQQIQQKDKEVTGYEANQLLAKYGFKQNTSVVSQQSGQATPASRTKTFEEMCREQESAEARRLEQIRQERIRPRAVTFDDSKGAWTETKWASSDENQIGIQVTIVTDMKF